MKRILLLRGFRPEQPRPDRKAGTGLPGFAFYATPDYLARLEQVNGRPDLLAAEYIGFDDTERLIDLLNQHGLSVSYRNFSASDAKISWFNGEWVKRGLGIGLMLEAGGRS